MGKNKEWLKQLLFIIWSLVMVFPFLFVIVGATKDNQWVFEEQLNLKFSNQLLSNWQIITERYDLIRVLLNTFFISFTISFFGMLVIFFASYVLNRYHLRYARGIQLLIVLVLLFPGNIFVLSKMKWIANLGIINTYVGLIIPFIVNLHVFRYFNDHMDYLPQDIVDSGWIDGCNDWQLLFHIVTPIMKPQLLLAFALLFTASWNNFLLPLLLIFDSDLFTMPLLISSLADPEKFHIGATLLAIIINSIPIIGVFFYFQLKRINKYS